jgi:lysophospholipase L1-like esterase
MHEALSMTAPLTGAPPGPVGGSCPNYPSNAFDPTAGNLQSLVQSESQMFYPVLGSYSSTVKPLTQLGVALSLKPAVTTVWLGANDLLKYIFSDGASPVTDTPAQFQADLTSIVTQLKNSGSKVIVADLPNVLETPQFFQGGVPANPAAPSQTVYFYLQTFSQGAISAAQAGAIAGALQTQCGVGSGGYLTETGMFDLLQMILNNQFNPAATSCQLTVNGQPGLGELYLTDTFAAQVQALNTGYNKIIDSVAAGTGSVLVPITATFDQIYAASNNGSSATPYYYVIPGTADLVSLRFGGKLVGFDGLHPSDTGYGLIANVFIGAAEAAGINIPNGLLSGTTLNAIYNADPYFIPSPFVPNAPMARRPL